MNITISNEKLGRLIKNLALSHRTHAEALRTLVNANRERAQQEGKHVSAYTYTHADVVAVAETFASFLDVIEDISDGISAFKE